MKKLLIFAAAIALCWQSNSIQAQEVEKDNSLQYPNISTLDVIARADFDYYEDEYGFNGKYFIVNFKGDLGKRFSYNIRQRMTSKLGTNTIFDNTDMLSITYKASKNFSFTAGKMPYYYGSYEFDKSPYDVYYYSNYCNNVMAFNFGIAAAFTDNSGKNTIQFQVINSQFNPQLNCSLLDYGLMWIGNFDNFHTLYSINMSQYEKGKYLKYLALSNRFDYDVFKIYVDLVLQGLDIEQMAAFDNMSIISRCDVKLCNDFSLFAKGAYETNVLTIIPTPFEKNLMYGIGGEYIPKGCKSLRAHAFIAADNNLNGSTSMHYAIGLTWRIHVAEMINRNKK